MPLDDLMIEAAKSELAFFTANQQATLSLAAETSFVNQALRGVPQSYQRDLLSRAGRVTKSEVESAIKKWLMPIFDPATSIAAVATSKGKLETIQKQLEDIHFDVKVLEIVGKGGEEDEEEGNESMLEDGSSESWSEVDKDEAGAGGDTEMK